MQQIILYLQCDKTMTPTIVGRLRTKESSNTQISLITMADGKRKRTLRTKYGLYDVYNPLFQLSVDLFR